MKEIIGLILKKKKEVPLLKFYLEKGQFINNEMGYFVNSYNKPLEIIISERG